VCRVDGGVARTERVSVRAKELYQERMRHAKLPLLHFTEPARVQTAAAAAAASAHVTSAASHCLAWGCMPEHCSGIMLSERPHLAVDALMQGVRRQAGMRAQVFASIPACIDLLEGPYIETNEGVVRAFRPSQLLRPAKA